MIRIILLTIWQLPQTLLGWLLWAFYRPYDVEQVGDVFVCHSHIMRGGISLGQVVIVSHSASDKTIAHELGHCKQSQMLGWLYLIVIGLPSILWASTHRLIAPHKSYYDFYTEKWADRLAGIER